MIYIKFLETQRLMQQDKETFNDILKAKEELHKKGYKEYCFLHLSPEDRYMLTDDTIGLSTNCETLADIVVDRLFKEVEGLYLDNNRDIGVLIVSPRYLYTPLNLSNNALNRFLNRIESSISKRIENNKIYIEK